MFVSESCTVAPQTYDTYLQRTVYKTLIALGIFFERVATDAVITMEDCACINRKLKMKMVKTLFLCNSQKTKFYLLITVGDKPFNSKQFSKAIGSARVSFAPRELMEQMLGVKVGAATVFSKLLDPEDAIQLVFDSEVLADDWFGCSDGTTTGYMKVKTTDIFEKFMCFIKHCPQVITL
ncbi:prolyl-tRNA synthetase associated domain-containing protein [Pseudomonas sp. LB3P14]